MKGMGIYSCSLWATASTKAGTLPSMPSISGHDVRRCGGKRIGPADPITKVRDDEAGKGKSASRGGGIVVLSII